MMILQENMYHYRTESNNIASNKNGKFNMIHKFSLALQDNITEMGTNKPILAQYNPKKEVQFERFQE